MSRGSQLVLGLVVTVVGVLVNGCTASICDRSEAVFQSVNNKSAGCAADGGVDLSVDLKVNKAECETHIKECTAEDQKILNSYLDCLDKIAACTPGTQVAFVGSVLACTPDMSKVTAGCLAAYAD